MQHEQTFHTRRKSYCCRKCEYVTHTKARFTKHMKYHAMPMIKCELCDFQTPYKWNLDRHNKNHNASGDYKCAKCNFAADIKQSLTVHEMNHHVPPIGQNANGINNSNISPPKRRCKVGASDTFRPTDISQQQMTSSSVIKEELVEEENTFINGWEMASSDTLMLNQDRSSANNIGKYAILIIVTAPITFAAQS